MEAVAREWHEKFKGNWTSGHAARTMRRFEQDVFPWLGTRPIKDVTALELLATIRRIKSRGTIETAHRILQNCGQVFRYVFPSERTTSRPMSENTVNGALRRLGYGKDEMTGHGFRSMACPLLHEQGWPSDVVERQLAYGAQQHQSGLQLRRRNRGVEGCCSKLL